MRRFSPILSANLQHRKNCVKVAFIILMIKTVLMNSDIRISHHDYISLKRFHRLHICQHEKMSNAKTKCPIYNILLFIGDKIYPEHTKIRHSSFTQQEVTRGRPFPLGLLDDDRGLWGRHYNCGGVGGVGSRHRQPGNSLSTETLQKLTFLSKTSAQHSFACHLFIKKMELHNFSQVTVKESKANVFLFSCEQQFDITQECRTCTCSKGREKDTLCVTMQKSPRQHRL